MSNKELYGFAVALAVLIGLFCLVALGKMGWQEAAPIISAIVFYYLGIRTAQYYERRLRKNVREG